MRVVSLTTSRCFQYPGGCVFGDSDERSVRVAIETLVSGLLSSRVILSQAKEYAASPVPVLPLQLSLSPLNPACPSTLSQHSSEDLCNARRTSLPQQRPCNFPLQAAACHPPVITSLSNTALPSCPQLNTPARIGNGGRRGRERGRGFKREQQGNDKLISRFWGSKNSQHGGKSKTEAVRDSG